MDFQKGILGRLFRRSMPDASKPALNVQEEVVAPADAHSHLPMNQEPLIVSPTFAKEMMLDQPDQSTEDAASTVNDLALYDVSQSSPKPLAAGKRKRQQVDVADGSPRKRVAKGSATNGTRDEYPTASTNGTTEQGSKISRASLEVVEEAPGKLPRPKKQRKGHMVVIYPAVQKSDDIWDPAPNPEKRVERPATSPTRATEDPPNLDMTPRSRGLRPRGRPPRGGPSSTKHKNLVKKKLQKKPQDIKGKPLRKGRQEGHESLEVESREGYELPVESLKQSEGQNAQQGASRTTSGGEQNKRAPQSKSTRSAAAASGLRDDILNASIDLTKRPERDARRAAKQRRSLEQTPLSSPPNARVDSLDKGKPEKALLRAQHMKKSARAKAREASDEGQEDVVDDWEVSPRLQDQVVSVEHGQEEEGSEREGRRDPEKVTNRDVPRSNQMDERKGAEAEEGDSDFENSNHSVESDEEENEGGDEAELELELFGQDEPWKTLLEGAHSVCGPKLPLNHMPKLLTESIRDLIHDVREARLLYDQLFPFKGFDHDSLDALNEHLRERLDAIEGQIRALSEKTAANKASEMIRDIYARAIPAMVFLLQSALVSRVYYVDRPYDLDTLNEIVNGLIEIVRLQNLAILLCEKATNWKAKPIPTSRPIVRPTSRKIFPCLKDMRKAFSKSLAEHDRRRKVKQNAVDNRKRQEELAQSAQQAKQEVARKNEVLLRKIKESREQEDERRRNQRRTFNETKRGERHAGSQPRQVDGHIESNTHWSNAEDLELYYQLEKGYAGGLTSMFIRTL